MQQISNSKNHGDPGSASEAPAAVTGTTDNVGARVCCYQVPEPCRLKLLNVPEAPRRSSVSTDAAAVLLATAPQLQARASTPAEKRWRKLQQMLDLADTGLSGRIPPLVVKPRR